MHDQPPTLQPIDNDEDDEEEQVTVTTNHNGNDNDIQRISDIDMIADTQSVSKLNSSNSASATNGVKVEKAEMLGAHNLDLPPPAAKNIKFRHSLSQSASHSLPLSPNIDPNKKARIERYVLDSKQHGIHAQVMIRILCVYARLNKGVEYVQGMNELLAPIYYIFNMDPSENRRYAEADSFFCFMNLMSYLSDRFIAESDNSQLGIIAVVNEFDELLSRVDYELWSKLQQQNLDSKFYALRWLMLLMSMEFQLPEVLRLWDSFLSDHNRFEFVTYFAIAMMYRVRPQLMSGNFASNLQLLQKYPSFDLYELLVPAMQIRDKYPMNILKDTRKKKKKKKVKSTVNYTHGQSHSSNTIAAANVGGNGEKNNRKKKTRANTMNQSARQLFDNMMTLRPQSTRSTTPSPSKPKQHHSSYSLFRSRSPMAMRSSATSSTAATSSQTFSFQTWKKKWGAK